MLKVRRELLESLVDDSECEFDHHGDCQAHGFFGFEPDEMCPQAELKRLLSPARLDVCPVCGSLLFDNVCPGQGCGWKLR